MVPPLSPFVTPTWVYYVDDGYSSVASARSPCNVGSNSDAFNQQAVQPVAYPRGLFAGDNAQPTSDPQSTGASGQASTTSSLGEPQTCTQVFGASQASKPVFSAALASTEDFRTPPESLQPAFGAPPASKQAFGAPPASRQYFGSSPSFSQVFGASQASKQVLYQPQLFGSTSTQASKHVLYQSLVGPKPTQAPYGFGCPSSFLDYRQLSVHNQLVGSRVIPYSPTAELREGNRSNDVVPYKFTSISAMKEYSDKSHEELRLEDYRQKKDTDSASFTPAPCHPAPPQTSSCPAPPASAPISMNAPAVGNSRNMFTFPPQPSSGPAFGAPSASAPISMNSPAVGTGNSRNTFTFPPQPSSGSRFGGGFGFAPPASAPISMSAPGNSHNMSTFPPQPSSGSMFGGGFGLPPPASAPISMNAPMFTFPPQPSSGSRFGGGFALPPPTSAPISMNAPMFTFPPQPSSGPRFGGGFALPPPASAPISMNAPMFTLPPQPSSGPAFGAPPASAPTSINQLQESLPKQMEDGNSPCVPKGLEIIVEKLGINPWLQGKDNVNKDNYPIDGSILRCDEADKDADIISLAVFAVEQHNALYEGDHYTFAKVVVACLEPIQGGRYHIVLDTNFRGPGFKPPVRHYAVVLRKCTQNAIQMAVLEKWLSSTTVIPPSVPL